MRDTIMEAYGDDIGPALEDMDQSISEALKNLRTSDMAPLRNG